MASVRVRFTVVLVLGLDLSVGVDLPLWLG